MKHVSIEIIQKCPNECIHCSSLANIECKKYISTEKVKEIINGLYMINTENISISGGEPFLHTGLLEIVDYAISKGISVDIYTSGIMLDEYGKAKPLSNKILERLSNIGVNKVIFNLQSLKCELYDEIMQTKNNLPLLMESIKRCKNNGVFTEIHFVPMKINIDEIDDVIEFVNKIGIDRVSFLGLIPHGRAKANKDKLYLDNKDTISLKKKLSALANEKVRIGIPLQMRNIGYTCTAGKEKLYIKFDGTVYGCEAFKYIKLFDDNNEAIEPDSIYDRKIEELFYDSKYLKAESDFIREQKVTLSIEEKCPVQRSIRYKAEK